MGITEEELNTLLEGDYDIDKFSSISDDGDNLLIRIPRVVVKELKIKKGNHLRWMIKNKKLKVEVEK